MRFIIHLVPKLTVHFSIQITISNFTALKVYLYEKLHKQPFLTTKQRFHILENNYSRLKNICKNLITLQTLKYGAYLLPQSFYDVKRATADRRTNTVFNMFSENKVCTG